MSHRTVSQSSINHKTKQYCDQMTNLQVTLSQYFVERHFTDIQVKVVHFHSKVVN